MFISSNAFVLLAIKSEDTRYSTIFKTRCRAEERKAMSEALVRLCREGGGGGEVSLIAGTPAIGGGGGRKGSSPIAFC